MKVTVNVDLTPEEARAFLGLPDVKPMQEQLLRDLQHRLTANLGAMDPDTLFRTWFPATFKGFEQWQELIAAQMSSTRKE